MMANISYCRFHNTLVDFKDCYSVLDEARSFTEMDLSEDENRAMLMLANHSRKFLERFEELQMEAEYEFARDMEESE
jgi:hypothetical protein